MAPSNPGRSQSKARRLTASLARSFDTSPSKAVCLLVAFAAFGAFAIYERQVVKPRTDKITDDFQSVAQAELLTIRISAAPNSSLVSHPITIPPERAGEFLALIRDAKQFQPNHPVADWVCEMTVSTRHTNFAARISATSNNGLLIYLDGGATLRCDRLRVFLEGVTRA